MIPGLGRSPGEGNDYPLQYSGLENSMDCIVYGVSKSRTGLSNSLSLISFTVFSKLIHAVVCAAAVAAKSLQLCPTLCNPVDGSPSGSPVPGILQARTLEWVAISFSNA